MRDRYLSAPVLEDLGEAAMVFVGGPRQEKWHIPLCYQVVRTPGVDILSRGIRIVSADRFLASLK